MEHPDQGMALIGSFFCVWCLFHSALSMFVCCFLQGSGRVHGATLQAPALRRQEAGLRWQEEHLHGASASYRE